MKKVAQLLNDMKNSNVVVNYALFGATAQMRYTEPVATFYADLLVEIPEPERIDILGDVYQFCADRGYQPEGEAVRVGDWPVQFIPKTGVRSRQCDSEKKCTNEFAC